MITVLDKVCKDTLEEIIRFFLEAKSDGEQVAAGIGGDRQDTQNDFQDQTIIKIGRNDSETRAIMLIYKQRPLVETITLYGQFSLTFSDLENLYKTYRKVYSRYDDSFVFFFNEDRICTFLGPNDVEGAITNLSISL